MKTLLTAVALCLAGALPVAAEISTVDGKVSPSGTSGGSITPSTVTITGTGTKCLSVDDPTLTVDCNLNKVTAGGSAGLVVTYGVTAATGTFTGAGTGSAKIGEITDASGWSGLSLGGVSGSPALTLANANFYSAGNSLYINVPTGADAVFRINATDQHRFSSTGRFGVGVGGSSPGARFEVKSADTPGNYVMRVSSQNGNAMMAVQGDGAVVVGSGYASLTLDRVFTSSTTPASTDETTLVSYTLPANTLNANGRGVRITAWGTTAGNGNTKTILLKWGGTAIVDVSSIETAANGKRWKVVSHIMRSSAGNQITSSEASFNNSATHIESTTPAKDETAAQVISITGDNGTASAADITFSGWVVELLP